MEKADSRSNPDAIGSKNRDKINLAEASTEDEMLFSGLADGFLSGKTNASGLCNTFI